MDVHVLDHCGNLGDACVAASLAALMAFRKPQVEFVGDGRAAELVVHSVEEREPTPLSIHHLPIAVTFALFEARAFAPAAAARSVGAFWPGLCHPREKHLIILI